MANAWWTTLRILRLRDPRCDSSSKMLKAFVCTTKAIVRLTMENDDAMLFKACTNKKPRLKGLGIITHIATVRCQIDVDEKTKKDIATNILRSQARRNAKKVKEILDKGQKIKLQKLVTANKTTWSSSITATKEAAGAYQANKRKQEQDKADREAKKAKTSEEHEEHLEEVKYYHCGTCGNKVPTTRKAFHKETLDAKTWCSKCAKRWLSKTFKCQCGLPWHKCDTHQPGERQAVRAKLIDDNRHKRKRPAQTFNRQALREDLEGNHMVPKRRKFKVCEPVFRPSMLSSKLRLRFASLCQDGEG